MDNRNTNTLKASMEMYNTTIKEIHERMSHDLNSDGTRKYSDDDINERIKIITGAQCDTVAAYEQPGITTLLAPVYTEQKPKTDFKDIQNHINYVIPSENFIVRFGEIPTWMVQSFERYNDTITLEILESTTFCVEKYCEQLFGEEKENKDFQFSIEYYNKKGEIVRIDTFTGITCNYSFPSKNETKYCDVNKYTIEIRFEKHDISTDKDW